MMQTLLPELAQQAAALQDLTRFYRSTPGGRMLSSLLAAGPVTLTGMGASYHAAGIAAWHLNDLGVQAAAFEAIDFLNYGRRALSGRHVLVYVSQSGRSGEIGPLLAEVKRHVQVVAVTNDGGSPLARAAVSVLPICARDERLVASKSYTNSLAVLWLAARQWAGLPLTEGLDALARVAEQMAAQFEARDVVIGQLMAEFGGMQHLVFLGHGPHAYTARQAAMMISEWAKAPAHSFGIGAFRHGFIETVTQATGAVIFGSGRGKASAEALANELAGYGARVLLVENGALRRPGEPARGRTEPDEFLSPLLDIVPVLLFTEALATQRLAEPGFRHIGKVVTNI